MRLGEVFAGIGGLGLGLSWGLGHTETLWQVEYEEHARLILAQHWPEAERHKDVRDVGSRNLAPVDLICGGFPCQPHSLAGKRQASADERDLWGEFARIIGELGPRWVVAENVPGLLSSRDPAFSRNHPGGFFGRVLRDLAEMGFDAEWACFPAAAVGAHHLRNRVFLIAYPQRFRGGSLGAHETQKGQPEAFGCRSAGVVAHPLRPGRQEQHAAALTAGARHDTGGADASDVAYAEHSGRAPQSEQSARQAGAGEADSTRSCGRGVRSGIPTWAGGDWEQPHPLTASSLGGVRDVAHGPSLRVAELTRLGNGVVPQQAAVIGRAVKDAQAHWERWGVMPERLIRPEHFQADA